MRGGGGGEGRWEHGAATHGENFGVREGEGGAGCSGGCREESRGVLELGAAVGHFGIEESRCGGGNTD